MGSGGLDLRFQSPGFCGATVFDTRAKSDYRSYNNCNGHKANSNNNIEDGNNKSFVNITRNGTVASSAGTNSSLGTPYFSCFAHSPPAQPTEGSDLSADIGTELECGIDSTSPKSQAANN